MLNPKKIMILMGFLMLVSLVFAVKGVYMHKKVHSEEAKFHDLQSKYFGLDKATRDNAPANSDLNKNLVSLQQYPSKLMELKLLGLGKLLTGIYVLLFGILIALIMMPVRLGKLICPKCGVGMNAADMKKHKH